MAAASNQDVVSLQVSLPQMLDIALGAPEVGAVNLNILHNFLHILVHQINLKETTVEYRGDDAARIQTMVASLKPGPSLHLQEYQITDGKGQVFQRDHDPNVINANVFTVDNGASKKGDNGKQSTARDKNGKVDGAKSSKGMKQKIGAGGDEAQSVIFVETVTDGVAPTALGFKRLEDSVLKLQKQFEALEELATTPEMIERIKEIRTDPLTDMWHIININKRLDAAEQGITKITAMMQDLLKSDKIEVVGGEDPEKLDRISDRLAEVETNLAYIAEDISSFREVYQSAPMHTEEIPKVLSSEKPIVSTDPSAVMPNQGSPTSVASGKLSPKSEKVSPAPEKTPVTLETSSPPAEKLSPVVESGGGPTKSPSRLTSASRTSAGTYRRPIMAGEELTAVKNDVNELKSELAQTKYDLGQVFTRVEELERGIATPSVPGITRNESGTANAPSVINPPRMVQQNAPKPKQVSVTPSFEDGPTTEGLSSPAQSLEASKVDVTTAASVIRGANPKKPGDGGRPLPVTTLVESREFMKQPSKPEHRGPERFPVSQSVNDDVDMIRIMEALRNIEIMYGEALQNLDGRVINLEREMKILNEKVHSIPCGADGIQEMQELMMKIRKQQAQIEQMSRAANKCENFSNGKVKNEEPDSDILQEIQDMVVKIQNIQLDIDHINQTAARLAEEKYNREVDTNALLEQIELLKTIKADKEDLEDALADKADAKAVKAKVSYDQFDTTCDDLARGLEDTIAKLTQQESIWQQALDDVQREIEGKLDKIEIGPIKDFVDNRLKMLQDKLKKLGEQRRESEAAGTKKMLSDVQCISCDKNVVMRTQEDTSYRADSMPCSRSIKPYLTYELDQVRQQQRKLPGRNMIQFNAAARDTGRRSKLSREDMSDRGARDHLCNRYCGGSHTVTTPHQRVMRLGHFLAQWGPEAVQLTDGVIKGTDGQLYRGSPTPAESISRKPEGSSPRGGTEVERPATPSQQASRVISPQKSQMSQKKSPSVTQATSKRTLRRSAESTKEIRQAESIIEEQPHPSPRSEPEGFEKPKVLPDVLEESTGAKSPEFLATNEEDYNNEDEINE